MNDIRCFDDVAKDVIKEASKRFSSMWKIDEDKLDIFEEYCDAIDTMVCEWDGISLKVEVDEISMQVSVVLECYEIIVRNSDEAFCKLIERADKYGFGVSDEGNLLIKFVFPSLWHKK